MLGALRNLFRPSLPPEVAGAGTLLTAEDRHAIVADLAGADTLEAGLGGKLAAYVVSGTGNAVLLHLQHLAGQQPDKAHSALVPDRYRTGEDTATRKRRVTNRVRVLFGLQGFDPAAMQRYGDVFACLNASGHTPYYFPGTGRSPLWFRSFVQLVGDFESDRARADKDKDGEPLPAARARAMLAEAGPGPIVDCLFVRDGASSGRIQFPPRSPSQTGLPAVLAAEPDAVLAALNPLAPYARTVMAEYFATTGLLATVPAFFEWVFAMAGSTSKAARQAALSVLGAVPAEQMLARATQALASASADERLSAVAVLAARGPDALPLLQAHESKETSKRVKQAAAAALATLQASQAVASADAPEDGSAGYTGMDGTFVSLPAWPPSPDTHPADALALLEAMVGEARTIARRAYDAAPATNDVGTKKGAYKDPLGATFARDAVAVMAGTLRPKQAHRTVSGGMGGYVHGSGYVPELRTHVHKALAALLNHPDMSLPALVRLRLAGEDQHMWSNVLRALVLGASDGSLLTAAIQRRLQAGADPREVAAVAKAEGMATAPALALALDRLWSYEDRDGPSAWTLLAEHLPLLDDVLKPGKANHGLSPLVLLQSFPVVPRRYFSLLLDRAATGDAGTRKLARALLRGAGDLTPIISTMLRDGEAARRTAAARWLGERRDPAAVPPLRDALVKEKGLAPRAALLAALAGCGDDISGEFSEERLLAEADAGLPKARVDHKDLFDPGALPVLRWADGREVPARVVQWWFARAHKLRQPGGDPLLHMALERLDRADAEQLGQAVLSAFIQFDTRRTSVADAEALARQEALGRYQSHSRWNKDYTEEQAYADIRREALGTYLGSALPHSGLLALARFAPPANAVAMVRRYLRDHGKRNNQCRALLDALAANPQPVVLQLILATAQRHKQPGTRKHAAELADTLARDRGWTAAELADRTVPTAGLDEDGALELPIGERTYRARIAPSRAAKDGALALVLENPDGKPVSALPTPPGPAEAEEAKAAKKALSDARKELKETVLSQSERLYGAMCAGRSWPPADFEAFLLRHPIVGRLLQRLVLLGLDGEAKVAGSFRALDDGTFSDAADNPVDPHAFASVGIAHRATLGGDASAAWAAHLQDYEVQPLFDQFNRSVLTAADAKADAITDRVGWMTDTSALARDAGKRGYVRGAVTDGGGFDSYDKPFPDVGLAAVIRFTGSYVGETDRRAVALQELVFVRLRQGVASAWASGMALGQVPPVLLGEAWNDLHEIAAQGPGFDADWRKKASW